MTIDWTNFSPLTAVLGGVLMGLVAAVLVLFNGRIAGVSGILGGLLRPSLKDWHWRVAFLLGVVLSPVLYGLVAPLPEVQVDRRIGLLIVAGLLVGIGTRYGGGCTTGHGICGIARGSGRSMVATLVFMAVAIVTAVVSASLLG